MLDIDNRQSNFELLRILCMGGVMITHLLQSLYELHTPYHSVAGEGRILLMNISIIAVNCFVLISGYFGIRLRWKSVVNLYTQCAFYAIIAGVYMLIMNEVGLVRLGLSIVFPLTEAPMWFVRSYFLLLLISPLLNAAFERLDSKQQVRCLTLLFIVDVYAGYMHQVPESSQDGYNLIHMITVYWMGKCISSTPVGDKNYGALWGIIVVIMTLLHAVKMHWNGISIIYSMRYNSPMVLLASYLFFQWVRKWTFKSRIVNWIAGGVFAVYLIHMGGFGGPLFFNVLHGIQSHFSGFFQLIKLLQV